MARKGSAIALIGLVAFMGGAATNGTVDAASRPFPAAVSGSLPASETARLIVRLRDDTVRLRGGRLARVDVPASALPVVSASPVARASAADVASLDSIVRRVGADVRSLFGTTETLFDEQHAATERFWGAPVPNKNSFFELSVPASNQSLAIALLRAVPAVADVTLAPTPTPPPTGPTPDFTSLQRYRSATATTGGLDADALAGMPGGDGAGVTIADVEYSWNRSHEELISALAGDSTIPVGVPIDPFGSDAHGTAVLGVLAGAADHRGITGLAPGASLRLVNTFGSLGYNPAAAISAAHAALHAGDVILVEQQMSGPRGCDGNQVGCVPAEWDAAVYTAIKSATAAGITVVEAAGNGWENLDDATIYGSPFPAGRPDSGALIVGAGTSCSGTPRSRIGYSNHGRRIDVQGWGECVFSSGFGDYWNSGPNATYTANFGGTSAAAATVAGAVALLSSLAKHQGVAMSPLELRDRLVATGTPGVAGSAIGPLPDLHAAAAMFLPVAVLDAPTSVTQRQVATLSALRSTDPQSTPLTYAWDLDDDGAFDDSTASSLQLHVSAPGPLPVRVRVTDAAGAWSIASATVIVQAPPKTPAGEIDPPTTTVPSARSSVGAATPRPASGRAAAPAA